MGKHVAAEMERVNEGESYGPDKGVWYDYNYFAEHQKDPGTYPWDDEWRSGPRAARSTSSAPAGWTGRSSRARARRPRSRPGSRA